METMNSNQSEAALCRAQAKFFSTVGNVCKKTPAGRLLGIPLFIVDSALECAKSCSRVGEPFFKGCLNLRKALSVQDEMARINLRSKAFTQFREAALYTLVIPLLPLVLLVNSLVIPLILLLKGSSFTEIVAGDYEEHAKKLMPSDEQKNLSRA
ncbi:hypothetical protein PHSC3_000402 [Chlamydiales bacterium STE3]|nr:hypothetical protein PHSC3_000402 [Chlamydiales bacterium STE3]